VVGNARLKRRVHQWGRRALGGPGIPEGRRDKPRESVGLKIPLIKKRATSEGNVVGDQASREKGSKGKSKVVKKGSGGRQAERRRIDLGRRRRPKKEVGMFRGRVIR